MSQDYCVKWCFHPSSILNAFEKLRTNEVLTDVTLAADGQFVRAHRVVLCACSSYFQEIFTYQPEQNVVVVLKDVAGEQLDALMQYMYKGQVHLSQTDLPAFLKTAQSLRINGIFQTVQSKEDIKEAPAAVAPTVLLAEANLKLRTTPTSLFTSSLTTSKRPPEIKIAIPMLNPPGPSSKVSLSKRGKTLADTCKNGEGNTPKPTQDEEFVIRVLAEEFDVAETKDKLQETSALTEMGRKRDHLDDSQLGVDVQSTSHHQCEVSNKHSWDECFYKSRTAVALKRHKRRMHKSRDGPSTRYKCDRCPKDYKDREYLYRHQRYECGKEPKFACPHCTFRCFWRTNYSKHLTRVHMDHSEILANETRYPTLTSVQKN